jgi:hypothetical protein
MCDLTKTGYMPLWLALWVFAFMVLPAAAQADLVTRLKALELNTICDMCPAKQHLSLLHILRVQSLGELVVSSAAADGFEAATIARCARDAAFECVRTL